MTTTTFSREELERALVEQSFLDFLDFVKVEEPGKGAIPYEKWPHLIALASILPSWRLLSWLKARQIGCTWLVAAYVLWKAMYHPSEVCLLLSKRETDAKVFLKKCVFIYQNLPAHLRAAVEDTTQELRFPEKNSRIMAMPSSPETGRSETGSVVVVDEADFQPYLEVNYAALKPTIDAGGQMILLSTSNPYSQESKFKELYRAGALVDLAKPVLPQNGGWARIFIPWHARPGRGPTFKQDLLTRGEMTAFELEKEYPDTEEEALAPARAAMFFDRDALTAMLADCREPLETRLGAIKVWRKPVVAGRYVAFADCAWGETMAYDCLTVMDWATGDVAAEVHARLTDDEMAKVIFDLCAEYNKAFLGVESNGEGINVVHKLIALGYGNRMYHRGEKWQQAGQEFNAQRGWWTNETTRPVMLGEYAEAVRNRQVVERCKESVQEHFSFIRNERGRAMHAQGAHDDHVMSRAGAWQMRKYARFSSPSGAIPVIGPPAF